MDGIINLNKPAGITSHAAVETVRRLRPGVKVGHAGTLDPAATGVLPLCLGRATRLAEYMYELRKGYRAEITLGIATATGDAAGRIISKSDPPLLKPAGIGELFHEMTGLQEQTVPAYSAAKYRGQPLYKYARRGETVPEKRRTINVYRLELLSLTPKIAPQIVCEVECSRGTYIRALAEEIGRRLGCGAHLHALERTHVGPFRIESSFVLGDLERSAAAGGLEKLILPMDQAVGHFHALNLADGSVEDLRAGRAISLSSLTDANFSAPPRNGEMLRIYNTKGQFKAVAGIIAGEGGLFLKTVKFLAP